MSRVAPIPTTKSVQDYKMPMVRQGTPVRYYPSGMVDGRQPDIGFVLRCTHRAVVLFIGATGRRMETVRHVTDPKLQLNADQRESGAWDYTEDWLNERDYRDGLSDRLLKIEKIVAKLDSARSDNDREKKNDRLMDYSQLRTEARSKGVEFTGNPSKVWLEEELEKLG